MINAYGFLKNDSIKKFSVLTKYQLYKKGFIRKAGQVLL